MQKKRTILVVASLLVVVLSVTLAYFTAQIIGKGKSVNINSANLQIIFTDSDGSISGTNIEPGKWNVTKTFTIENKSNETYKYNIVIQNLVNTFVTEGYLQYKITSTNGGFSTDGYVDVPKSETAKDTILAYSASIEVGVTQTYTIEFIYKNDESVDQSVDMNKKLSGTIFIMEYVPPSLASVIKSGVVTSGEGVYYENGYRYEGSNPNNYIQMNKTDGTTEIWRIIGLFPDGENGEDVIRVRKHYERNNYPTMAYDENSTNHFPNTTMYSKLSNTYNSVNYNRTVNFKMYLGTSSSYTSFTAEDWYTAERGNVPGKTAADSYNNEVSFIGSVGLIYPSDYGYGALASECSRTIELSNYNTASCYKNNWLNQTSYWLISPSASASNKTFFVLGTHNVDNSYFGVSVVTASAYFPVMALSADVKVIGNGTSDEPYVIQ